MLPTAMVYLYCAAANKNRVPFVLLVALRCRIGATNVCQNREKWSANHVISSKSPEVGLSPIPVMADRPE